ncbi:hypothetical protein [Flavobacterium sp.]|uniref:hypothetical protein n=2 Tax=Flavobacterium sp. TaxID=239 RepID=UPI0040470B17
MIKYIVLTVWLLLSGFSNAQSKTTIDSLWMATSYLQAIQKSIPKDTKEVALKMQQLDSLIGLGTEKKGIVERQLNKILIDNPTKTNDFLKQYDLVLQSAILLKTDLNQNQFGTKQTNKEMAYLDEKSAYLIDKLYFYAKYWKSKIKENTH